MKIDNLGSKRIIIAANGLLTPSLVVRCVRKTDFLIGVDGGTDLLVSAGIFPDLIVGDLDSVSDDVLASCKKRRIPILSYPAEKDQTDLELAMDEAIKRKPGEIVGLGFFGDRPDHTLANIQLLQRSVRAGISTRCFFERGVLYAIDEDLEIHGDQGDIVSLLPLTEKVTGINLAGFKYLLEGEEMVSGVPLGISNVLVGEKGVISIKSGILLVFHFTEPVQK